MIHKEIEKIAFFYLIQNACTSHPLSMNNSHFSCVSVDNYSRDLEKLDSSALLNTKRLTGKCDFILKLPQSRKHYFHQKIKEFGATVIFPD